MRAFWFRCYVTLIAFQSAVILLRYLLFCTQRLMLPSEGTEDDLAKQDFPNLKVKMYNRLMPKAICDFNDLAIFTSYI